MPRWAAAGGGEGARLGGGEGAGSAATVTGPAGGEGAASGAGSVRQAESKQQGRRARKRTADTRRWEPSSEERRVAVISNIR